jgi:hypothetical protein
VSVELVGTSPANPTSFPLTVRGEGRVADGGDEAIRHAHFMMIASMPGLCRLAAASLERESRACSGRFAASRRQHPSPQ